MPSGFPSHPFGPAEFGTRAFRVSPGRDEEGGIPGAPLAAGTRLPGAPGAPVLEPDAGPGATTPTPASTRVSVEVEVAVGATDRAGRLAADWGELAAIAAAHLGQLRARAAAKVMVPIGSWEFAERVWMGLRPQLRTRLYLLEGLRRRFAMPTAEAGELDELGQFAREIQQIESEVETVLRRRASLDEFSTLLEERLTPCLWHVEALQKAFDEHRLS